MKRASLAIAVFPVIYLLGAFIAWDFNPGNWDIFTRLMAAFVAAWAAIGVAILE